MRIVYVAWHGSVHTRRWVSFFAARGHKVDVITCGGGDAVDLDADGNVIGRSYRVHDLGEPRFGKLGYLLKIRRARRIIRATGAELVHAHFATSYGLLALCSGLRPMVVTAHGDDVLIAPRNPILRRIVQRVLRAASLVTVPSEPMRAAAEELIGDIPDAPGVAVFQYGVETTRLAWVSDTVRSQQQPSEQIRIVSARALLQLYRIDALLDALSLLRDRGTDFSCELLGDGPERGRLEQQARELGLDDQVNFRGHCSPTDVEHAVASADVYVSVSESDGVSLALLEALALGAVPVLSDIPANRGWVHDGETGALVQITPESIADGIMRAAALDRERVARDNHAVVAEHADRDTNLGACELLIDALVGVEFDRAPIDDSSSADAA